MMKSVPVARLDSADDVGPVRAGACLSGSGWNTHNGFHIMHYETLDSISLPVGGGGEPMHGQKHLAPH